MRIPRIVAPAFAGLLLLSWVSDAAAQNAAGERRSGWYVGGGAGVNWASDINQRGSNRDHLCYPRYACYDEQPRPNSPATVGPTTCGQPSAPPSSCPPDSTSVARAWIWRSPSE